MAAKAGEIARETTKYLCQSCNGQLLVRDGVPIPNCPTCGCESFQTGARAVQQKYSATPLSGFANFP